MDLWLAPHDFRVRSLKRLSYGSAATPFGTCVALATETHLLALSFSPDLEKTLTEFQLTWPEVVFRHEAQTDALVFRAFRSPGEIPVMAIGTPFQLTVWEFLRTLPPSTTVTYGEAAKAIGRPGAARAVGRAVGANKIAVVIPCHRIVSRGSLTGYRWGLELKRQLLGWELSQRDPLSIPF